ncbi:MAG TPA: hypothetical protein DCK97_25605, partial [Tistrella mobilis]|nr:hypothetical protein [Tistrella mobilis]
GPRARDSGVFDWQAAYFSSLGYAVLQPNYRGSTGQGEAFIAAGVESMTRVPMMGFN